MLYDSVQKNANKKKYENIAVNNFFLVVKSPPLMNIGGTNDATMNDINQARSPHSIPSMGKIPKMKPKMMANKILVQ